MRALTSRLLFTVILSQIIAIMVGMLLFPLLAPYTSFDEIAERTVRLQLAGLARFGADGALKILPDGRLDSYLAARPRLKFAVVDLATQKAATNSDPVLVAATAGLGPFVPRGWASVTGVRPDDPAQTIIAVTETSAEGTFLIVTSGNSFGWSDIGSFFVMFLPVMIPIYAPVIIGALIAIPYFIARTLRPLAILSRTAEQIQPFQSDATLPEDGVVEAFLPLIRAINDALKRLQSGLARQRLYAANAAHELRTPVTILKTRIESLPETPVKTELAQDTTRIETLVEQWLAVARLQQIETKLTDNLDLVAVVTDVVADRAPLALRAGQDIVLDVEGRPPPITGQHGAIRSAIANLIDNALHAEPKGGVVEVKISADRTIAVVDHGRGVSPENRDHVFEPFWRGSERPDGTGLGLAIVKEVMERHSGTVTLTETRGGGATFTLQFPAPVN